jgi:hypothetical protein
MVSSQIPDSEALDVEALNTAGTPLPSLGRGAMLAVLAALGAHVLLVIAFSAGFRYQLNPDGISYLRIASYYARGDWTLAVSGYWGPLLSWLMAPFVPFIEEPAFIGRIGMGLSALVFWCGCVAVLYRLRTDARARLPRAGSAEVALGAWVAAVCGALWAVGEGGITPDLLMGGLLCLGISGVLSDRWRHDRRAAFTAGLFLGLAYLARSPAFPLSVVIVPMLAALWAVTGLAPRALILKRLAVTALGFALVSGPWIAVLSAKYGKPVFATNAPIAHAVEGPSDQWRDHPSFRTFHRPESGRVTSWEDPTSLPYRYWSPVANRRYAWHQARLMYRNALDVLERLGSFDWLHAGLFAAVFGFLIHRPWRKNLAAERWRWALIPVACVGGVYLPVHANEMRFYYVTLPFLFAAAAGLVYRLTRSETDGVNVPRGVGLLLVTVSFLGPPLHAIPIQFPAGDLGKGQVATAYDLAARFKASGIRGSIAGNGPYATGLYLAFFTDAPWYGDEPEADAAQFEASGADLALVDRRLPIARQLDQRPDFEDLDPILFSTREEAAASPARVYRIRRAAAPAGP